MWVEHLSLTSFRSYRRLELSLPPGLVAFQGANAQGKTNLLEAVFLLARGRSPRSGSDAELINWAAGEELLPLARLAAQVRRGDGQLSLEVIIQGQIGVSGLLPAPFPSSERSPPAMAARRSGTQKRVRVNGAPRRVSGLIGRLNVVWFTPEEIDLVGGSPSLRRRYLDDLISPLDPGYLRTLQRYQRVLSQRNHLLRRISEGEARPDELAFWDEQLVETGSYLLRARFDTLDALSATAEATHHRLSGSGNLALRYEGKVLRNEEATGAEHEELKAGFWRTLKAHRRRELAQGVTVVGPHRDDLRFSLGGTDMGVYGSRGQQRTIALALKLAEAELLRERTGEEPVLLLDDVLSELDEGRRHQLLEEATTREQVLLTTTDLDRVEPRFLAEATTFRIREGEVEPLD